MTYDKCIFKNSVNKKKKAVTNSRENKELFKRGKAVVMK